MRTATADVVKKLIGATKPTDMAGRAYIDLAYHSGVRPAEACALQWADIDFAAKTVHVSRGKGGYARTVTLHEGYGHLKLWYEQSSKAGPVFVTRAGRPWHVSHTRRLFANLCERAGVDVSPHSLRHGCALQIWQETKDLGQVSDQLGHRWLATTDLYLRDRAVSVPALRF